MIVIGVVLYLFLIFSIIHVSPRLIWLVFFLFCYRFWEGILSLEQVEPALHVLKNWQMYGLIVIFSFLLHAFIVFVTKPDSPFRYLLMAIVIASALAMHPLLDIFMFKDYLDAWGWWDIERWKDMLAKLVTVENVEHTPDIHEGTESGFNKLFRWLGLPPLS